MPSRNCAAAAPFSASTKAAWTAGAAGAGAFVCAEKAQNATPISAHKQAMNIVRLTKTRIPIILSVTAEDANFLYRQILPLDGVAIDQTEGMESWYAGTDLTFLTRSATGTKRSLQKTP